MHEPRTFSLAPFYPPPALGSPFLVRPCRPPPLFFSPPCARCYRRACTCCMYNGWLPKASARVAPRSRAPSKFMTMFIRVVIPRCAAFTFSLRCVFSPRRFFRPSLSSVIYDTSRLKYSYMPLLPLAASSLQMYIPPGVLADVTQTTVPSSHRQIHDMAPMHNVQPMIYVAIRGTD